MSGAKRITEGINYELSSRDEQWHDVTSEKSIFNEKEVHDHAFHTKEEKEPFIKIDLGSIKEVHGIAIKNRTGCCQERAKGLTIWVSSDGKKWEKYWTAKTIKEKWNIPINSTSMGATMPGLKTRYIKLGVSNTKEQHFHLNKIEIYAK